MNLILFLAFLVAGASAGPSFTSCYTDYNLNGYYVYFNNYAPDLRTNNFDNVIDSVQQTGMWIYYENPEYNTLLSGRVYFVHGIDIIVNFPYEYTDITSSLRYVGSPEYLNDDTITFYAGTSFTGSEYYVTRDTANFGPLSGRVSSFIITGTSAWTIYSREGFTGDVMCVYSDTDHDVGGNGQFFDLGIYPDITAIGAADNSIMSVRKGCWGKRIVRPPQLNVLGRQDNGAWGYLTM